MELNETPLAKRMQADMAMLSAAFRAPDKPIAKSAGLSLTQDYIDRETAFGRYNGWLKDAEDHILAEKGGGNLDLYKRLLSDDLAASNLQQRRLAVIARDWSVEPGAEDSASMKAADFMRELIDRLPWDDICDMMLYATWYGYGVAEAVYATDGAQWTLERIDVPDRAWFGFNRDNELCFRPKVGFGLQPVPDRKFWMVNFGADHSFNPYGKGLAHWCYWPIFFKRVNLPQWTKFLEKSAKPTVLGKAPSSQLEDDSPGGGKERVMKALADLAQSGEVAIPMEMEAEILSAARAGEPGFDTLIMRMEQAITRVILSQTMTTYDGSSRSQAEVHKDVRDEVIQSDSDRLHESFNGSIVKWLTEWNFAGATPPRVYRVMDDPEDVDTVADRDTKLKALGWVRTDESFAETYGEGQYERSISSQPEGGDPGAGGGFSPDEPMREFAAREPDEIDRFVGQMLNDSDEHVMAMAQPIIAALEGVRSPEQARLKMLGALEAMDAGPLAEFMARAGIYARAEEEGNKE